MRKRDAAAAAGFDWVSPGVGVDGDGDRDVFRLRWAQDGNDGASRGLPSVEQNGALILPFFATVDRWWVIFPLGASVYFWIFARRCSLYRETIALGVKPRLPAEAGAALGIDGLCAGTA